MAHFLVIDEHATSAELAEAITHLRAEQRRACIPSTAAEYGEDIDECLELLFARLPVA